MSKQSSPSGLSFFTLLTLLFIVLKLCSVIAWSWWWVLAPLWIPFVIGIIICIGLFVFTKW